jgi:enamine deaminase RidA (YjgF/YER057c/UK114 family)
MLTAVNLPDRPPPAAYSQAIEAVGARRMLFISGQVGVAADGTIPKSVSEQVRLAIANLNALLAQARMTNRNIVKYTIYLTDEAHLPEFMAAGSGTLPSPPPAATLLIVKALADPALLVEIEAMAVS